MNFCIFSSFFPFLGYNDLPSDSDSGDDWEEIDEDQHEIPCLFCVGVVSGGFPSALQHIEMFHKFNFCDFIRKHIDDTYSYIKLINFIRYEEITPEKLSILSVEAWDRKENLRPVKQDDPWLMYGKYKEPKKQFFY